MSTPKRLLSALTVVGITAGYFVIPLAFAEPVFSAHGYNSNRKDNQDGTFTSEIYGKYVNYYENGWKNTDLTPVKNGRKYEMLKGAFHAEMPERANGTFKFTDRHKGKNLEFTEDPISKTYTFPGASNVLGTPTDYGMEYVGAIPNVDSLVIEMDTDVMRNLLRWDSLPTICDTETSFNVDIRHKPDAGLVARTKRGQLVRTTDEPLDGFNFAAGQRTITTPQAYIWDSGDKREEVIIEGKWKPAMFNGHKVIECSSFDNAVYPVFSDDESTFYPDPSVESTTVDGVMRKADSTNWDTSHDAASSFDSNDNGATFTAGVISHGNGLWSIYRSIFLFDCTDLGEDAISDATLGLYGSGGTDDINSAQAYVNIVDSSPASNTAIVTADYNNVGDAVDDPTQFSTAIDHTNVSTSGYNDFVLDANGIANISAGVSKFGVRSGHDMEDNPFAKNLPSDTGSHSVFHSADAGGTSTDPKLVVTHSAAGGGALPIIIVWTPAILADRLILSQLTV